MHLRWHAVKNDSLTVFFDGACALCTRAMDHYRARDVERRLRFVDIAAGDFDASAHGLAAERVQATLHVRLANGELRTGGAAAIAIWERIPDQAWLARAARGKRLRPWVDVGYHALNLVRAALPKRASAACTDGACAVASSPLRRLAAIVAAS